MSDAVKKWALALAVVALLVYLGFAFMMMGKTGDSKEQWANGIVLLGGIEALAFAAAGWLWGQEVSRKTIDQANSRVADAKKEKDGAETERKAMLTDVQRARADAVAAARTLQLLGASSDPSQPDRFAFLSQDPLATDILARYDVAGALV